MPNFTNRVRFRTKSWTTLRAAVSIHITMLVRHAVTAVFRLTAIHWYIAVIRNAVNGTTIQNINIWMNNLYFTPNGYGKNTFLGILARLPFERMNIRIVKYYNGV